MREDEHSESRERKRPCLPHLAWLPTGEPVHDLAWMRHTSPRESPSPLNVPSDNSTQQLWRLGRSVDLLLDSCKSFGVIRCPHCIEMHDGLRSKTPYRNLYQPPAHDILS